MERWPGSLHGEGRSRCQARRWRGPGLGLLIIVALAGPVRVVAQQRVMDEETSGSGALPPRFRPGWGPALSALVFPGPLVHGVGVAEAGDPDTGLKLLAAEGAGLTLAAGGFVPIVVTGASRELVGLATTFVATGLGLVFASGAADIYGAAGGALRGARPRVELPIVESQTGYAYVYDPQFRYRSFSVSRIDARVHGLRLSPETWVALDDDNQRYRGELAYRFFGPRATPAPTSRDGSFVELQSAVTYHRFGSDSFSILTWELSLAGRCDLARLAPTLSGSFAQLELGWGLELYGNAAQELGTDKAGLLLARLGFGLYLGRSAAPHGELLLYYDHRHDDFAGGLSIGYRDEGLLGHVGLQGQYHFTPRWGLGADVEVGAAYLGRLSLSYSFGGG